MARLSRGSARTRAHGARARRAAGPRGPRRRRGRPPGLVDDNEQRDALHAVARGDRGRLGRSRRRRSRRSTAGRCGRCCSEGTPCAPGRTLFFVAQLGHVMIVGSAVIDSAYFPIAAGNPRSDWFEERRDGHRRTRRGSRAGRAGRRRRVGRSSAAPVLLSSAMESGHHAGRKRESGSNPHAPRGTTDRAQTPTA